MMQLLQLEWLKLKNYRTFWVMIFLFTLLLTIFYVLVGVGLMDVGTGGINIFGKASGFGGVWDDLCFFASYFIIALAILMAIITTNEFQYKTHRQNIIDGWSRLAFFHSKWIMMLVICLATTFFVFLLGMLSGILGGLPITSIMDHSIKLFWLFLLCVNYLSFALTLSLFFKRSGLTIGILMFYSLILEAILHVVFLFKYHFPAGDFFLPLQVSDELLPLNASKVLRFGLQSQYNPQPWAYAIVTLIWITLYYWVGRRKMMRSDW